MIEAICNLMKQANADQVQLNIKLTENGAQVILNTKLNPSPVINLEDALSKLSDEAKQSNLKLRTALSKPLVAQGSIAELDLNFADYIVQYSDSYVPAANAYNSLTDTKASLDAANSTIGVNTKKTAKTDNTPAEIEEAVENEVFDDEEADSL